MKHAPSKELIAPPTNFTHVHHIDKTTPVKDFVQALKAPVTPMELGHDSEFLPLPHKISSPNGTLGRGTLPRGGTVTSFGSGGTLPRGVTVTSFGSDGGTLPRGATVTSFGSGASCGTLPKGGAQSSSSLNKSKSSSISNLLNLFGTLPKGKKTSRAGILPSTTEYAVPITRAPPVPKTTVSFELPVEDDVNRGRRVTTQAAPRNSRSVSASCSPLDTVGYVNVKTWGENEHYLAPHSALKRIPPARPDPPKTNRSSTLHVDVRTSSTDVVFRPTKELPQPPPRDSHHETAPGAIVASPDRITVQLARPNDLFGTGGPGLGLGLGTLGLDEVVPLSSSLDSGVSEAQTIAPAAPEPGTSISPEEVRVYLEKLRCFYTDLKEHDSLDSAGYAAREAVLKPAAQLIIADIMESNNKKQKRPAPEPPISSPEELTPTTATPTRPVPKPRTSKMQGPSTANNNNGKASMELRPDQLSPDATPMSFGESVPLPSAVQLNPAELKTSPVRSYLAKLSRDDSFEDDVVTRL